MPVLFRCDADPRLGTFESSSKRSTKLLSVQDAGRAIVPRCIGTTLKRVRRALSQRSLRPPSRLVFVRSIYRASTHSPSAQHNGIRSASCCPSSVGSDRATAWHSFLGSASRSMSDSLPPTSIDESSARTRKSPRGRRSRGWWLLQCLDGACRCDAPCAGYF